MIVFDASSVVGAVLKAGGVPERALLRAVKYDVLALSVAVATEIAEVLEWPKFARISSSARRKHVLDLLYGAAI